MTLLALAISYLVVAYATYAVSYVVGFARGYRRGLADGEADILEHLRSEGL